MSKEIILRDYQVEVYNDILSSLNRYKSVLGVVPTGGGKSVLIGKMCQDLSGRTLVLTHREEILTQNSAWIDNVGMLSGKIDTLRHDNRVVVAMVQTLNPRLKKFGLDYLGDFDNIILDEVQILIFEKVFSQYNYKKLIGFTGTPVVDKKITTTIDGVEFVQDYTMSEIFDHMVQGMDTQELIDLGNLVQEHNVALDLPDFDKLKESSSSPDGYTKKSLNEVYSNKASLDIVLEAYRKYGEGKKTLIFNASAEINKIVCDFFKAQGLNAKLFDSVNPTEMNPDTGRKYTRKEIVQWFSDTPDAILVNVNVFTTGFSENEVECIILNRATKSLSLYIQIVGRGSRPSNKILKDYFTLVDLGQNIHEHGRWSEPRDWEDYFTPSPPKRKRISDMLSTWECDECFYYNEVGEIVCANCGKEKVDVSIESGAKKKDKKGELVELSPRPLPKGNSIVNYAKSQKQDSTFAFKVLDRAIIDLFKSHNVAKDFYENNKDRLDQRIKEIYMKPYFAIINSDLKGVNRTLDKQVEKVRIKVEKIYNYEQ